MLVSLAVAAACFFAILKLQHLEESRELSDWTGVAIHLAYPLLWCAGAFHLIMLPFYLLGGPWIWPRY